MEAQAIEPVLETLRERGGFCRLDGWGMIEVTGQDAERFLMAQTTNDVKALAEGDGQLSAILDRKAHVKALFTLYRQTSSFSIVAESVQIKTILEHLDQFRFADKVEFRNLSSEGIFFLVQGPESRRLLASASDQVPDFDRSIALRNLFGQKVLILKKSLTGEDGFLLFVPQMSAQLFEASFKDKCRSLSFAPLLFGALETARVEAGILRYGVDVKDDNLMPETGLDESAVSYSKGCFLGQEVLARVKSHGAPSRGMAGLVFLSEARDDIPIDTILKKDGGTVAVVKSNLRSPALACRIALAYLRREYRVPDKVLTVESDAGQFEVKVVLLPFVKGVELKQRARVLYEEALLKFAGESDSDKDSASIELLAEAILLDPLFEDAFESLGVILSRRDRLDEAIERMQALASLNPDSVMAHANLSVFYMQKGMIEKAEEEKAISMSIRMRLAAREASQAFKQEEEKKKEQAEAKERMEMFRQVLEIDPDDLLANYGMGSCLIALDECEKAVEYLNKAIEVKPMHTVAYVDLARAFDALGRNKEAKEALNRGIDVASRRGDMMPLKTMQQHLSEIEKRTKV